jgi:hypothetical protein
MARVTRPGGAVAACMWDIATGGMTMLRRTFWAAVGRVQPGAQGEQPQAGARVEVLDGLGHWWMAQDPARAAAGRRASGASRKDRVLARLQSRDGCARIARLAVNGQPPDG